MIVCLIYLLQTALEVKAKKAEDALALDTKEKV